MIFLRFLVFSLSVGLCVLSIASTTSVWIVGEKNTRFFSSQQGVKVLEGLSLKGSLVDPENCTLWAETEDSLIQILPSLQIQKKIPLSATLLGSELVDGLFITVSRGLWTLRDPNGNPIRSFPSLVPHPTQLQGQNQTGFFSLQFDKEKTRLDLLHFDRLGNLLWVKPVSETVELWSQPKLNWVASLNQVWISFTTSSSSQSYSPLTELWSSNGERIVRYPFSERGLLLDTCITANQEFLLARDIPSSPYTIPLFSFLEWASSKAKPRPLYQARDNYLINSVQCRPEGIWTLQKSVLGGQDTLLVELSHEMQEKTVLPIKEPAWKIHACSLQ